MVVLSNARYEQIKRIVVQMFEEHGVRSVPISGFEIANRMGISVIPYSAFTPSKRELALAFSEDGFSGYENGEYVALVSLSEYYKFITDDNGHLIRHIFESNVRDYQGNVAVNKQIEATLESVDTQEDFWWLNNGVTILAKSVQQQTGNHLLISEPEIVNGLQSSSEVHAYFSRDLSRLDSEARCILLRVIVPQTEESRDHVILATNSQTAIPKSSLRASDVIHRQIEIFFKGKGLFYSPVSPVMIA